MIFSFIYIKKHLQPKTIHTKTVINLALETRSWNCSLTFSSHHNNFIHDNLFVNSSGCTRNPCGCVYASSALFLFFSWLFLFFGGGGGISTQVALLNFCSIFIPLQRIADLEGEGTYETSFGKRFPTIVPKFRFCLNFVLIILLEGDKSSPPFPLGNRIIIEFACWRTTKKVTIEFLLPYV